MQLPVQILWCSLPLVRRGFLRRLGCQVREIPETQDWSKKEDTNIKSTGGMISPFSMNGPPPAFPRKSDNVRLPYQKLANIFSSNGSRNAWHAFPFPTQCEHEYATSSVPTSRYGRHAFSYESTSAKFPRARDGWSFTGTTWTISTSAEFWTSGWS